MLIGNRESLAFELVQVEPSWELRYAPEAAGWAGLSVWVAGKNLCAHVRSGEEEVRSALFVPLGPMADWLVRAFPTLAFEERPPWLDTARRLHDLVRKWGDAFPPAGLDEDAWLDRREAFWSGHFLVAGAEGAWLPNLGFLREDEALTLVWTTPRFSSGPSVTFLYPEGQSVVRWADFEAIASRFVEVVAEAFESKNVAAYTWLDKPPPRLRAMLEGATSTLPIALFCARPLREVALLLGIEESMVAGAVGAESIAEPAANPLLQVFRDLPPRPSAGIGAEASATVDESKATAAVLVKWTAGRALAADAARAGADPIEEGQLAARALRDALKIDAGPVATTTEVLRELGVASRATALVTQHEHMLVAAAAGCGPVVTILTTERTKTSWGRRFEEARALGHVLLDPLRHDALGAASTRWAQGRRYRRSGAFAAEFLLPRAALQAVSGGHLDSDQTRDSFLALLERFNVGARTAAFQLYNHRLLSRPMRDELIAEHARD